MLKAYDRRPGWWPPRPVSDRGEARFVRTGGFSMVEALVGMALFSLLFLGLLTIWTAGWKTESKARTDSELQRIGRDAINTIVYGETLRNPPVHGLIKAKAVITSTALSALTYEVVWYEKVNETTTIIHDDAVSYYLSGDKLYRYVEPFVAPLRIVTSGGEVVAEHILAFSVTPDGANPYPVELEITVGWPGVDPIVFPTTVTPRNVGLGG